MLPIVLISENKSAFVRPILESLPEWFGIYEATEHYIRSAEQLVVLGCKDNNSPVGVITLKKRFEQTYEIDVMGVVSRLHRSGVGQALIKSAVDYVRDNGAQMLTVKTLGASHDDKNYAATRAFYLACGFIPLEEFTELWDSGNPCLFMVKSV